MLSLFPQCLFLAPLAITLLRIAVAIGFALGAWRHLRTTSSVSIMLYGAVELVVGLLLFVGAYTQAAGLVAALMIIAGKSALAPSLPLSRDAQWFALLICICLIMTGAGAFAIDLPL